MKISVDNVYSHIDLDSIEEKAFQSAVKKTAVFAPGYRYTKLFKNKKWDGKVSIYGQNVLTGLVPSLVKDFSSYGLVVSSIQDNRNIQSPILKRTNIPLRDYQSAAIKAALSQQWEGTWWPRGVISMATGCHARGTKILMADGQIKPVEKILVGDKLAGPAGPRTVLNTVRGKGSLYRVFPYKGKPFTVNEDHILSLIETNRSDNRKGRGIINVSIRDYLKWSKTKKHLYKLYRSKVNEFEKEINNLPIEPYMVGVLLGDGSPNDGAIIHTVEPEIVEFLKIQADQWKLKLICHRPNKRIPYYSLVAEKGKPNYLVQTIRNIGLNRTCENKYIPHIYKTSSVWNRLEILAGLIDTDGHINKNGVDFVSKSMALAKDVAFIARSLGMSAYISQCEKYCQTGGGGIYYRVSIWGDLSRIPTLVNRKKIGKRIQKKDVLRTGFVVNYEREGEYFGFELDGDHLYLLEDFTVTHNSGKTRVAAAMIQMLDVPTIFLVHRKDLMYQTHEVFRGFGIDAGMVGDGLRDVRKTTIAMVQTLQVNLAVTDLSKFKQVFFDECLHPSHDILTDKGWIPISLATKEHKVAQYDDKSKTIDFVHPIRIINKQFSGNLVHIKGANYSLLGTPNHEQPIYKQTSKGIILSRTKLKDIRLRSRILLPSTGLGTGDSKELTFSDRFKIMYQADGCHIYTTKKTGIHSLRFSFRKDRKIDRCLWIINNTDYGYTISRNKRGDTNIIVRIKDLPPKKLSEWVTYDVTSHFARQFLEEVEQWDGTLGKKIYDSTDKDSALTVQTMARLAGMRSTITSITRMAPHNTTYRVRWRDANSLLLSPRGYRKEEVPFDGRVYCVEVPKGNIVVRRGEDISITGNCHLIAADLERGNQFVQIARRIPAPYRWGLSGTPFMHDKYSDRLLEGTTGGVLYEVNNRELINAGYLAESKVIMHDIPLQQGISNSWPKCYDEGIVISGTRNQKVIDSIQGEQKPTLVLVQKIGHGELLEKMATSAGLRVKFLSGKTASEMRKYAVELLRSNTVDAIIATVIFDEGIDIPEIRTVILAGGGKSPIKNLQRLGRGLRKADGKNEVTLIDFYDRSTRWLAAHSRERKKLWESQGFKVNIT